MYEDVMCCVCNKKPAKVKWMCMDCYNKLNYEFKIKSKFGYSSAKESHPKNDKTLEIISEWLKGDKAQTEIAKEYGCSRQWVSYIIRRYREEIENEID